MKKEKSIFEKVIKLNKEIYIDDSKFLFIAMTEHKYGNSIWCVKKQNYSGDIDGTQSEKNTYRNDIINSIKSSEDEFLSICEINIQNTKLKTSGITSILISFNNGYYSKSSIIF